ncbi:hypothetical protein BH09MYX1_BH09MYX1_29270 [soil metagenome]
MDRIEAEGLLMMDRRRWILPYIATVATLLLAALGASCSKDTTTGSAPMTTGSATAAQTDASTAPGANSQMGPGQMGSGMAPNHRMGPGMGSDQAMMGDGGHVH